MNLFHIYNQKKFSVHTEKILSSFEKSVSANLCDIETIKNNYEIYLIELGVINKTLSTKINKLFTPISNPLIYFIVPQEYNLSLFQLAFMVNAKTIITAHQDTIKIISKIKKDYQKHKEYCEGVSLGSSLINHHSYMLFKDSKLIFASKQLLRDFDCTTINQVQENICTKLDMQELLSNKHTIKRMVNNDLKDNTTFFIKSITNKNENLISFESQTDYEPKCNEVSYVSTRVSFIELLKNKLLEKIISDKLLVVLSLKINTTSKILTRADEENFRKEFLYETKQILKSSLILSQYDTDFYIALFESLSLKEIEEKAKNFHLQILRFLNAQTSKYTISLYTFNINTYELNSTLTTIDKILKDDIDIALADDENIKYINNYQDNMSEDEMTSYMLESIFINKTDLKLLNFYNGITIKTASKILKKTDDSIYVKIESIQGIAMQTDKKTILQSSILTKSIKAKIKHIDMQKGYAILHKFEILDYDPNKRQHGRVNSLKVIPIALSTTGSTIKGTVIDISATSIAIKVKNSKILDNILNKDITLTFYIENTNSESGSTKLMEKATVVHELYDENSHCKLICIFMENIENENTLIDYIFNRQKNIILDMKDKILNS